MSTRPLGLALGLLSLALIADWALYCDDGSESVRERYSAD